MRFLLIHTAGAEGNVALASEAGVVLSEVLPGRSSSASRSPKKRCVDFWPRRKASWGANDQFRAAFGA